MWKLAATLSGTAFLLMTVPAILLTVVFTGSDADTVSGTVRYAHGEMDLPAGSHVEVVLVNVAGEDDRAIAVGRQIIEDANTLPVKFNISYNTNWLKPGARHEVWVAIRRQGQLLFTTRDDHPVDLGKSVSNLEVAVAPPLAMP